MGTLWHVSDDVPVLLRDCCVCCLAVLQGEVEVHKLDSQNMQCSESSQPIEPGDVGTNNDGMYGQKWGIHNDSPYEVLPKVNVPNKHFF